MRIGSGFDIHRLENGEKLILGGVEIPFNKRAIGHSDGDVVIHSIVDAILGATGMGDIGTYFPDTDENIKGISSIDILKKIMNMVEGRIINIDITVICEAPRISKYREMMKETLAPVLKIKPENISIKGKTAERLGEIGSGNAIAAFCTLLMEDKV